MWMSVCVVYGWHTWKDGWRMVVYSNRDSMTDRKSNRKREPARRPLHTLFVAQHITSASEKAAGRVERALWDRDGTKRVARPAERKQNQSKQTTSRAENETKASGSSKGI